MSVFLIHAFNVKSILCFVNYAVICNIHDSTPETGILFTDFYIKDIFNRIDFMKH